MHVSQVAFSVFLLTWPPPCQSHCRDLPFLHSRRPRKELNLLGLVEKLNATLNKCNAEVPNYWREHGINVHPLEAGSPIANAAFDLDALQPEVHRALGQSRNIRPLRSPIDGPPTFPQVLKLIANSAEQHAELQQLKQPKLSAGAQRNRNIASQRRAKIVAHAQALLIHEPELRENHSQLAREIIAAAEKNPGSILKTSRYGMVGVDCVRKHLKAAFRSGQL